MNSVQGILPQRVHTLKASATARGDYVLYWMQQSQRSEANHALEYAITQANARGKAVAIVFGLTANYPHANRRHYRFMLEGLRVTRQR